MGLRINQNIAAQNAYRNLSVTDSQMSKSLEKLSSGFRINRAADDAAGLSISEGLRAQTGGLKVAVRNAQDAISVVQTAEGALNEVTSMLQRMRDLSVQANNASLDDEAKQAANGEFQQLSSEIDRIAETTSFGKSKLLDGTFGKTHVSQTDPTAPITTGVPASISVSLTDVGGTDTSGVAGLQNLAITVPTGSSAQDAAAAVNDQLSTALKAAGYNGDEVSITAEVAKGAAGDEISFKASGSTSFTLESTEMGLTGAAAGQTSTPGSFQIGANAGETLDVAIGAVNAKTLGLNNLDLTTAADPGAVGGPVPSGAAKAMDALDAAIKSVSDTRAKLGAHQNRFEHTINNLNVAVENLSASESRIRDTDMAQEMVSFTRNQILTQAGTSMLSQANQSSQNVLSLLR
jgi:flagellin